VCTRAGSSLKGSSLKYCDTCSLVFHHSCVRPALPSDHSTQSWSCTHCILERNRPGYSSGSNSYSVLDTLPLLPEDELDVYRKALNQMKKLSGMYLHAADNTDGKRQRHLIQPAHYKGVTAVVSNSRSGECVYEACFQDKGEQIVIGTYDDTVTAAKVRDSCARKLYGLCAPLNYPNETEQTARNKTAVALSGLGLKLVQGGDSTAFRSTASNTYSMASGGRKCIRRRIVAAANNAGSSTEDVNATAGTATNANASGHSDVDSEADDAADDHTSKVRAITACLMYSYHHKLMIRSDAVLICSYDSNSTHWHRISCVSWHCKHHPLLHYTLKHLLTYLLLCCDAVLCIYTNCYASLQTGMVPLLSRRYISSVLFTLQLHSVSW
jgi:hypothetical protein